MILLVFIFFYLFYFNLLCFIFLFFIFYILCQISYDINTGVFRPAEDYIVVMGNLDRFEQNNTLIYDISKIVYNVSMFNLTTYENDIALVFLNDSVPANYTRSQPISLNTQEVLDNTVCQVTGWGQTENVT